MTEPAAAMTDIDAILRQAEIQQKQLELEVQFQKNMELFKKFAKPIYDEYFDYKPEELHLSYDQDGYINLINSATGNPVYNRDPAEFCQAQVDSYCQMPVWLKIGFRAPENTYFFQNKIINKVIDKYDDAFQELTSDLEKPVNVMVITGCGLGYQIADLIERLNIYTLCIFDPHKDSFYASLHTLDWEPIIRYIQRPGRMLRLFIDNSYENTMTSLRLMTNKIGLHNISNTYIYQHLSSEKSSSFTRQLRKQFHLTLTGTGFLEDEQISIAHTVENLNRNTPVFNANAPLENLPPVFLVGNGPSLDGLLETLKEHANKAIIISCGSTIGTLYKAGIIPDFHIEMERTDETTEVLKELADAEYKKKIPILALNTVPPETLSFFKTSCIAIKVNDAGEHIIKSAFESPMPSLNVSNPTCTNTGISYALGIGFKEIYLLGIDLGMKDKNKHHASSSQYYDGSSKVLDNSPLQKASVTVKGNFSGEVETTAVLDTSRVNMELALQYHPTAKAYNLNDGAYIAGTTPLEAEQLDLHKEIDKESIINNILEKKFSKPNLKEKITEGKFKEENLKEFFHFIKNIKFTKEPKDIAEVLEELNHILSTVREINNSSPVSYCLLTGSTQNFFSLIYRSCLTAKNRNELIESYRYTTNEFSGFLNKCYTLMKKHCLKLHSISD